MLFLCCDCYGCMTERMSFIYPKGTVVRVSAIIGDESVKFGQILTEKVQKMA